MGELLTGTQIWAIWLPTFYRFGPHAVLVPFCCDWDKNTGLQPCNGVYTLDIPKWGSEERYDRNTAIGVCISIRTSAAGWEFGFRRFSLGILL
jgi:hypothetical protein